MTMVDDGSEEYINKQMDTAYKRWQDLMDAQPSDEYIQYYDKQIRPIKEEEKKILKRINIIFWIFIIVLLATIVIWWLGLYYMR